MPRRRTGRVSVLARTAPERTIAARKAIGFSDQQQRTRARIRVASHWRMTMPDDFTQRFQYGLNDLPVEPPDDPNILFSPNGFTSTGMQRAAQAQVVPARFRIGPRTGTVPPPPFPAQGGRPPGWPAPPIRTPEIPGFWNRLGSILPRIGNGPGVGSGKEELDCDEAWREARADCAEELAKPFPNRTRTGGYTNIEDCARGLVPQPCLGNPVDWGDQKNPQGPKSQDPESGEKPQGRKKKKR